MENGSSIELPSMPQSNKEELKKPFHKTLFDQAGKLAASLLPERLLHSNSKPKIATPHGIEKILNSHSHNKLNRRDVLKLFAATGVGLGLNAIIDKPASGQSVRTDSQPATTTAVDNEKNEDDIGILTSKEYAEEFPVEMYGTNYRFAPRGITLEDGGMQWDGSSGLLLPVEDMIYNLPGKRNRKALEAIIHHFNSGDEGNERYRKRDGKTYCNIYLRDVLRALCIPVPYVINEKQTLANMLYDFMNEKPEGSQAESWITKNWVKIPKEVAPAFANLGIPVIMATKNHEGHGHVAVVAPNDNNELTLSQAGETNGIVPWDEEHFSQEKYETPIFCVNIKDYGDE